MSKIKDLTGQRFGRLVVLERVGSDKNGKACWLCRCDCKKIVVCRGSSLLIGETASCGCLAREAHKTHGYAKTRLYRIWSGMKDRCYNSSREHYDCYGGRGITACDEWLHDFAAFRDWALSHGYTDSLTIDRINNDGNYCPDNCRWITMKEQAQNRRPKRTLKTE